MKRKNMGEMKVFFPLIGKTLDEGKKWLEENQITSPVHSYYKIKWIRGLNDSRFTGITMDYQVERLNVRLEDGKISSIDGVY